MDAYLTSSTLRHGASATATAPRTGLDAPPHAAGVSPAASRPHPASPRPLAVRAEGRGVLPSTEAMPGNIVTFTSPSGGTGLSTLAAMLAWSLSSMDLRCALVDADVDGGGLDVLLGIEDEPGLTMQELHAPLGSLDGDALNLELPVWEHVRVLAFAPWRGEAPDPWEVQAAVHALAGANRVVLVDAGRGRSLAEAPDLVSGMHLVGVELSVLGLARAKAHLARLRREGAGPPLAVGFETRGAPRGAGIVALAEAADYLGITVLGPIKADARLCGGILEGLGIESIPRRNRKTVEGIAVRIARQAGCDPDDEGGP
ncbi:P-loop NTPase [Bifidobacterium pullorum]|nr:P-loop NTPase [Bifidobacterium pullorum]